MSNKSNIGEIILPNETKHQVYLDVAQPAAQEVGTALQTIVNTFNTILTPLKALNATIDIKYKQFIKEFEDKSSNIPVENIRTPELASVGPALTDLAFSLDEPEIRSMYMQLLLQSIDKNSPPSNLRAFTQIIKQLTPFDSRLLKEIYIKDEVRPIARIRIECSPKFQMIGQTIPGKMFSTLITDITIDNASENTVDLSLQNFIRLGLIELYEDHVVLRPKSYSYVEVSQTYAQASALLNTYSEDIGGTFNNIVINKFSFSLTSFGESFCKICIGNI